MSSGPLAFAVISRRSSFRTLTRRKWTVDSLSIVRGLRCGKISLRRLSGKSAAPRLHFEAKNSPKHSAFWALVVYSEPDWPLRVGIEEFRQPPPACLTVDHHERSDIFPVDTLLRRVLSRASLAVLRTDLQASVAIFAFTLFSSVATLSNILQAC